MREVHSEIKDCREGEWVHFDWSRSYEPLPYALRPYDMKVNDE